MYPEKQSKNFISSTPFIPLTCESSDAITNVVIYGSNQSTRSRVETRICGACAVLVFLLASAAMETECAHTLASNIAVRRSDGHLTRCAIMTARDVTVAGVVVFTIVANVSIGTP